ncbi:MAG TPA: hypothetical protein PK733_07200 [Clostridiales bacterium]|nr:hypothetical protein [Clostridiales bacterium]
MTAHKDSLNVIGNDNYNDNNGNYNSNGNYTDNDNDNSNYNCTDKGIGNGIGTTKPGTKYNEIEKKWLFKQVLGSAVVFLARHQMQRIWDTGLLQDLREPEPKRFSQVWTPFYADALKQ